MKSRTLFTGSCIAVFAAFLSLSRVEARDLPLHLIQLPEGFKIEVFSDDVPNARSLALGDKDTVFVGTRDAGKVYALVDTNGDHKADSVQTVAEGLTMPNGVAFKDGSLYVAEIYQVSRYDDIEGNLGHQIKPVVINKSFPHDRWHGWKFIAFGPDDKLYVPVGAPCNVCEKPKTNFATIMRMDPNGRNLEVFAEGIRNTVGFSWHPKTDELWFTDNGRDMLGDNIPPDELNHAPEQGMHFGFPYCHGAKISDPMFGKYDPCDKFTPPAQELGAHVAALGMRFYTGEMFPAEYQDQIFLAEHGSWNRAEKTGYRIALVRLNGEQVIGYETFAEGWKQGEEIWGRPVDVLIMPDGSLLVSDDHAGAVYRISYEANGVP